MPRVNLLQTRQMYWTCGAFTSDASMDNETPAPSSFNVGITKDSAGLTCCRRPNSSWTTDRYSPVHWRSQATHLLLPDAFRALQTTSLLAHFSIRQLVRHLLEPLPGTPTCMHPISPEVTFGAEPLEYMCQFMRGEFKFKGFFEGEWVSESSTHLKMICLSIGMSCFVQHAFGGEDGVCCANPLSKIQSGGLGFPLPWYRRKTRSYRG